MRMRPVYLWSARVKDAVIMRISSYALPRLLSLRRRREFWAEHPEAVASLRSWYRVAKQARWQRFTDVRAHYRSADQVGKFTVFNIAGNAYRLITVIHFNTGRVYVRRVLTHAAYDPGTWQDD